MGTHLSHGKGRSSPHFSARCSCPQARILPITRIVQSTRQCAAGGYRGNPTGIATRLVMAALRSRCGHYIFVLFLSFFFLIFSSPNLSGRRLDVYHISTHDVASLSANLECRSENICTRLAENTERKKSPSRHHRTTLLGCIFATKA